MKYQYIILILLLFIGCSVQKSHISQNSKIIKAELYKIDFKDSIIIYHIRNEKMDGVFAKERYCKINIKKQKLLRENKIYKFILEQERRKVKDENYSPKRSFTTHYTETFQDKTG
jgi:hypothetical protein